MNEDAPGEKTPPNPGAFGPFSTPSPRSSDGGVRVALPSVPDHELLRCIGRGSYGEVWLARNVMGTYRAVKVVYRTTFDHDRPFEREFEGIQKFEPISRMHESQVDILHVGRNERDGYFYYVMELADDANVARASSLQVARASVPAVPEDPAFQGPRLAARMPPEPAGETPALRPETYIPKTIRSEIRQRGRLPLNECLRISLSLTTALEHLHKHGLIHRDIKPSNIIFVDGMPKLADLGMVASVDATLSFVGTEGFLPPEGPGTVQADIYSLGKVLYEVSMGRDRLDFPKLPPNLDQSSEAEGLLELNEVLLKACANDLRQRYQSAEEIHADLALLQSGKSVKRLRTVEHRLAIATRVGLVTAAIALVTALGYFGAVKQTRRAQRAEASMAAQLYVSEINRAYQFWDKGNVRRALELLEAHRPRKMDREDLRGFEWFYLWRRCQQDEALSTFRAHTNSVNSLAFSPDGMILATAGDDGTAILWDVAAREKLVALTNCNLPHQSLIFSPDGSTLAFASGTNIVTLLHIMTRRVVMKLLGEGKDYLPTTFSPDGKLLAALEFDSTRITIWEVSSGRILNTLRSEEGGYIYSASFSPDGKVFVVGHRDNLLTFYDVASWRKTMDLEVPAAFVGSLAFSPDGKTLALAGDTSTVVLCDVGSGTVVGELSGHENQVNSVAFSPDGRTIASASSDNTVKLWSSATRQAIATFRGHLDAVNTVAFSPDGKFVASGCADGTVKLWATKPRTDSDAIPAHLNWARSVAFSPDGKTLASAGKDKTVKLWDVASRQLIFTFEGHKRPAYRVAWSPDGRTLASVSGLITEGNGLGEVKLWNVIEHRELVTLTNLNSPVAAVAFSPDGRALVTGAGDGAVVIWNVARHELLAIIKAHDQRVDALAFSPNGKSLATGGGDNTVKLWDMTTRRRLAVIPGSPANLVATTFTIWTVAFTDDGKTLAIGNADGTVTFWDVASRELRRVFRGNAGGVYALAFTSDGKTLATGTQDSALVLWNIPTGQEMVVLKGHRGGVESVAFSPDGSILASASADKTVRLWRAATRAEADANQK